MGTLFIVATPIGNLKDITFRAALVLKDVDYVLCEDTRISGRLLFDLKIEKQKIVFNDFNEESKIAGIVGDLKSGKDIALVSDAGTPLISDPGYKLVRECISRGIKVEAIPGPSAVIAALTVSGLPPDKFLFLGYLPKKDGKRMKFLKDLFTILHSMEDKHFRTTVIFYESPYRLVDMLNDVLEIFGDIDIIVCRELTKIHEEVRREKISESIKHFSEVNPKGEFTVLM
ncbi:16S rRNA (cytidine(1402)-2'-O)-methyltransferase [Candidatus Curtissbacteria bacterium]|nr:16S rRNA (cytidine(1402)-2'-O)-methyltransferase [Candidatus Curtissbacteria bacterium]